MRNMLDGMQQLMTGESTYFDTAYLGELAECWEKTDPDLIQANDGAWRGLGEFFINDGYGVDPWGSDDTNFKEENATAQDYLGMLIYEPCNYASNLPNFYMATEMCNRADDLSMPQNSSVAIIQTASFLAMGSSAYHGSHTNLGDSLDGDMIQILSYVIHQEPDSVDKFYPDFIITCSTLFLLLTMHVITSCNVLFFLFLEFTSCPCSGPSIVQAFKFIFL